MAAHQITKFRIVQWTLLWWSVSGLIASQTSDDWAASEADLPKLRAAVSALRGPARVQAINTLADRLDKRAVPLLSETANDPDLAVAEAAIGALGKIATPAALEALAALRKKSNAATARALVEASFAAAEKLSAAGDRKLSAAIYEDLLNPAQPNFVRRGALEALLRLEANDGERRILEVLHDSDAVLKPVAIAGIRLLKSKDASEKFASELPRLSPPEQVWLLEVLADRNDAAAQAAIRASLAAENIAVRQTAASALARLGGPTSVPILAKALAQATNPVERQGLVQALTSLGGAEKTDQTIIAELKQAAPDAKSALISILAKRECAAAVPVLMEEADCAHVALATAAFQALGKLAGPSDLPMLLDKLVNLQLPEARAAAESAVSQVIPKVADVSERTDLVCRALSRATNVAARASLLSLLPSCEGARGLEALQAARAASDPLLRDAAVRALADWPDAKAWDALAEMYRQPQIESFRILALRALVRLAAEENARPDAKLLERYRQLLSGARHDDDRKLILGALGGVAHPQALPLVWPLLAQAGLRAEAELAVKSIAESIKARHPQAAQEALQRLNESKP